MMMRMRIVMIINLLPRYASVWYCIDYGNRKTYNCGNCFDFLRLPKDYNWFLVIDNELIPFLVFRINHHSD